MGTRPRLLLGRRAASTRLQDRIQKGRGLLRRGTRIRSSALKVGAEFVKWDEYNREMIRSMFDSTTVADEYFASTEWGWEPDDPPGAIVSSIHSAIRGQITALDSLLERLDLYDLARSDGPLESSTSSRRVFVVHGHDHGAKDAVARFLLQLNLEPVVLHERPNAGQTIIEKFELHSDVSFAVVLLTPDDDGSARGPSEPAKGRARQNVVFELGYFIGKLGRRRVCALLKGDVERPSDIQGILYVPMDEAGGWRLVLSRELQNSGIDVDLNRAV